MNDLINNNCIILTCFIFLNYDDMESHIRSGISPRYLVWNHYYSNSLVDMLRPEQSIPCNKGSINEGMDRR